MQKCKNQEMIKTVKKCEKLTKLAAERAKEV
jgi:hypothetical protein